MSRNFFKGLFENRFFGRWKRIILPTSNLFTNCNILRKVLRFLGGEKHGVCYLRRKNAFP